MERERGRMMTAAEIKRSYEQAKNPEKQIRLLAELNDCSEDDIRELLEIKEEPAEVEPKNSKIMDLLENELESVEKQIQILEERYRKILAAIDVIGEMGL